MSSVAIHRLLDSMQSLLKNQEGAVDQLSAAASEARQGNERWRIERQILASQILTAKCPSLWSSAPMLDDAGALHPDVKEELQSLSSVMTLTTAGELCSKTEKHLLRHRETLKTLEAMPDLAKAEAAFDAAHRAHQHEVTVLDALNKTAADTASPLGAIQTHFKNTPWFSRLDEGVRKGVASSNAVGQTAKKAEEALQELANWTAPKPWYVRLLGLDSENRDVLRRVTLLEEQTRKPIAVLVQDAARQLAIQAEQELKCGAAASVAYGLKSAVNDIESELTRLLPDRRPNTPWREALPNANDWRRVLAKEVTERLLEQEPLSQVARRANLGELVDPLEQAEAKRDIMSRIVDATEDALRARRNDVSQTSSQVSKISKAARKRPSQSISIDLEKVDAAAAQVSKGASLWRKEVTRLNTSISNAPRSRDSAVLPSHSSSFSSSSTASSSSSGMGFWEFYLWSSLLNGGPANAASPSALTGQVLNLDSSDVNSFGAAGLDLSSVNTPIERFDSGVGMLDFGDKASALGTDSWAQIDNTLSAISSQVESTSFSSCSSSSPSSSSCSSSSSSSSSRSSCGGGGGGD